MMRIGELAKQAKVTPRTVRYYQSRGLIPQGEREGYGAVPIPLANPRPIGKDRSTQGAWPKLRGDRDSCFFIL